MWKRGTVRTPEIKMSKPKKSKETNRGNLKLSKGKNKLSKCKIVESRTCQHCKVAESVKGETWQRQKANQSKCQYLKIAKNRNVKTWKSQIARISKRRHVKTSKCQHVKIPKHRNVKMRECQKCDSAWKVFKHELSNTSNFEYSDFGTQQHTRTTHSTNERNFWNNGWPPRKDSCINTIVLPTAHPTRLARISISNQTPQQKEKHIGDWKPDVISGTTFGTALREFESRSPSIICLTFHGAGGEGVNSH
jgi:hypothetical protein